MTDGRVRSRRSWTIFTRSVRVRLPGFARTSRSRFRSIAGAMSPQMARMSATMRSYAAWTPTVSRFGLHLMGAEPCAVPDVEEDDQGNELKDVGQERIGKQDARRGAQAQGNPDRREADAQTMQEAPAHHPDPWMGDEERAEDAARDAQDEDQIGRASCREREEGHVGE